MRPCTYSPIIKRFLKRFFYREYHFRCYKRLIYIYLYMNNVYTLMPNDVVPYQSRFHMRLVARDDNICIGMDISESCCKHI